MLKVYDEEDLKARAVELRLEGIRPKQITEILGSGHSVWQVTKWVRESGLVLSTVELVLREEQNKKTVQEIAEKVKVSERRVQQIIQQELGRRRLRRSVGASVELFLSDPARYMKDRFTQSIPFARALMKRCVHDVSLNPLEGLSHSVRPSLELFGHVWQTRRKEARRRDALCCLVQGRGIESHVYMVTDSFPKARHILDMAMVQADSCLACECDQLRRRGLLMVSAERWPDAWSSLEGATLGYRELEDHGHDLHGNGVANCLLLSSILHFHTISPEAGAVEAKKGIELIAARESICLFGNLVYALAKCLLASGKDSAREQAGELIDWCFSHHPLVGRCSTPRVMLLWLRGSIAAARKKKDEALDDLIVAVEDAKELQLKQEVTSLVADIGAITRCPREVQNAIEDFCDWDESGNLLVPKWCKGLERPIESVYQIASSTEIMPLPTLARLRHAAAGDRILPSFVIPPGSASSDEFVVTG